GMWGFGAGVEYANDAFCRATGYSLDEVQTLAPQRLVAPESVPAARALGDALRRGEVSRATVRIARKDGSQFVAACAAAPLVGAEGRGTHVVGGGHDRTGELRLREQLVRGERLSAVGALVSGVAHELNGPLQVLLGMLDVMSVDSASWPADLERLRGEARRASTIVRNLLAFVRKSPPERVLNDLNEIVRGTLALRAYELAAANVELVEEYATVLPLVLANREEIQQAVLNRVLTAERARERADRKGVLVVRTTIVGSDAALEIADNGPGVPAEARSRIFEPFFTTREGGATGMGLAVAFGIASSHGGSLGPAPASGPGETRGAALRPRPPGARFAGAAPR